ncbi:phospholipase/Carboxylesteras-like protein [Saccharata proteae CBS 121410]|uniref:Phospholipase/Carboxylesteras-like protein n=1 Tax=Saccharata proteae CBS 121410 TaxID=1314787 RepID=A0A9P4HWT9_9PEZI|nr:phospholipase/Carboxylesteras-like protein [Saccharata proteae CBS 121410]
MPKRQPTQQDFPSTINLTITPPPGSQAPTNVLLLLHGLGDTHAPFAQLGRQLSLPETVSIAIRAPKPLPFDLPGFHWGDDIVFDQSSGAMDVDTGFNSSTKMLADDVIRNTLIEKCGFRGREIILFGFAQGAMAALNVAAEMGGEELGGVVSVGGALPHSAPLQPIDKKCRTPIIVCRAASNSAVTDSSVARLKDTFEFVEVKDWKRKGDGMPGNRDEMLPIMQFFARRLRSTQGVPKGSVELT